MRAVSLLPAFEIHPHCEPVRRERPDEARPDVAPETCLSKLHLGEECDGELQCAEG
jgi:hypothetical protein